MIRNLGNRHLCVDQQFLDMAEPDIDQIIRKGYTDLRSKEPGQMAF